MARSPDVLFITEYIKNVLYFATVRQGKVLKSTSEIHYFCIDQELVYQNYYSDFGPLNLGCIYKYCKMLNEKVKQYLNKQSIVQYTSIDPKKKVNSAFLMGCYGMLFLRLTPRDALKPLTMHGQIYRPFQDATQGDSIYTISLLDCLQALKKARDFGLFNYHDFNYEEYEKMDSIQAGDLNWIVPGKFLAFIGPVDRSVNMHHPPEMYIDYFRENNVKIVIRLNKRMYDGNVFADVGVHHYDLFFPDGSCPPRHILSKFLQISEEADGAIAVHCKAGLGRTGSLIGCYLIKHYRMTAHEAIGWMRICRPGSVIGHQQAWLEQLEAWLTKQGNLYRKRTFQDTEKFPIHEFGVYSIAEKAKNYQPVVFNKLPSPPSIQRQTRSDTSPPVRPNASRIREGQKTNYSNRQEFDDEEFKEKFITSYDLTVAPETPPMQLKEYVLKNNLTAEEHNLHPRSPVRQSIWRKYLSCKPCIRIFNNGFWMLAVRCTRVAPQRCRTTTCCSLLDMVAPSKVPEPKLSDWRMRTPKISSFQKNLLEREPNPKTSSSPVQRQGKGAGEPRLAPPRSPHSSTAKFIQQRNKDSSTESSPRNYSGNPPMSTFCTTQGPVIKTLNDARNFLIRSSLFSERRDKQLNTSITVTPQSRYSYQTPSSYLVQGNATNIQPSPFYSASRGPTQPQLRRRLGRSPSPSPTRYMDQTRATNTPSSPNNKLLAKDASKSALREALSRLRLSIPRDGSVGAASLGARRAAPAPRRAPSVRSDERPIATQGDMLNSIKFQRQMMRDTLNADKLSAMYNEMISLAPKDKPNRVEKTHTKATTSTAARLGFNQDYNTSTTNAKPQPNLKETISRNDTAYRLGYNQATFSNLRERDVSNAPRPFFNPVRPTSPKCRQRSYSPTNVS